MAQFLCNLAFSQELPDLVCQTLEEVSVVHGGSLPSQHGNSEVVYRFSEGKLYLSSPGEDEYLYGDLTWVEPMRFTSGFKTILFRSEVFDTAIDVHTDNIGTNVRRLHCVRT